MTRLVVRHDESAYEEKVGLPVERDEDVSFSAWLRRRESVSPWQEYDDISSTFDRHSQVTAGDVLNQRFEITDLLGEGGMATVFKAIDRSSGKEVALKLVKGELAEDADLSERFQREIDLMRALEHPHILSIESSGRLDDGRLYLSMPVVFDGSLADLVGTRQPREQLARWALQILSALDYMHQQGVVHRDIKPANLLLRGDDVIVGDLGIAVRDEDLDNRLTTTLGQLGSLMYRAPEQGTTGKSDVFSLAIVLHQLTAGVTERPAAPGKRIEGAWGQVLRAMGAPDPDDRPTAAEALVLVKSCADLSAA